MQDLRDLHPAVLQLAQALQQRGWMLATAESCTGGMIAAACTDVPGSSSWFDGSFITYSNAAKAAMLGVPTALIEQHGAVSEPVVRAMATGAIAHSQAQTSIAVSGVAGPAGGTPEKPVGAVWIAWSVQAQVHAQLHQFEGDRAAIRYQAALHGILHLQQALAQTQHPNAVRV